MSLPAVTLTGKSVRLEPIDYRHAEDLELMTGEPEIWRLMSFGSLQDPAVLRTFIADRIADWVRGEGLTFAIIDLASGRAIGTTSLMDVVPADERLEIGRTWIGRPFWRTAVNTECKFLLLTHAFEVLACRRVQLQTDVLNLRSQAAILRLGATKEGVLRRNKTCGDGRIRDSMIFSILKEEWPGVSTRLVELIAR
jgi:RimJ/RimL family protein N-acetyltransferase